MKKNTMKKLNAVWCRICTCVAVVCTAWTISAATRYVAPVGQSTPTSPYTTEATAANELADAMGVAVAGDLILVKSGTYQPTASVSGFQNGLTIRSYVPGDADKTDRAGTVFDGSNLSGTFLGLGVYSGYGKNMVVDGFTFKNFSGAQRGSAISNNGNKLLVVTNCTFESCTATKAGGAIYATTYVSAAPASFLNEIVDCSFISCRAEGTDSANGGAVCAQADCFVHKCSFKDCGATNGGGHLYLNTRSHVAECTFTGSASGVYGQVLNCAAADASISNCVISDVSVPAKGYHCLIGMRGGLMDKCVVTNCTASDGVLMLNSLSEGVILSLRNCLIADCSGAATFKSYNSKAGEVLVDNCTIVKDNADLFNAADSASAAPSYVFRNSALIGKVNYASCVTSDHSYLASTLTVKGLTPFACPSAGNYRLRRLSDLVDGGIALDWHADATDLDGRPRTVGGAVDIGCYERQPGDDTLRVVATEAERTDEWKNAFVGIQPAIDAAVEDATILVKSGTYDITETIVVSNQSLLVKSVNAKTGLPDRDATVLDGGKARRIMAVCSLGQDYRGIPPVQRTVRIEGFTFKDGRTSADDGQYEPGNGGGLYLFGRATAIGQEPSSVVNCRFSGCTAVNGGGVAQIGGVLENCLFDGNSATEKGGGAACVNAWKELTGVTDYTKSRTWFSPGYVGCTFTNNIAGSVGGGVAAGANTQNNIYMADCAFVDNGILETSDGTSGAAMGGCIGSLITNCTFVSNEGGVYPAIYPGNDTHLTDCTFKDNSSSWGELAGNSSVVVDRCRFAGGPGRALFGGMTMRNSLFEPREGNLVFTAYYQGESVFENCTFAAGTVLSTYSSLTKTVRFVNCILYNSTGGALFGGLDANTIVTCDHCCLSKDVPVPAAGTITATDCLVSANPGFKDAANGDWSIRRSSKCRDKGVKRDWMTADAIDLAGNGRVLKDGRADAAALPDIGCYENADVPKGICLIVR